ncbi:GFA family protein [Chromobacterium subtsugae]|uniref:GFA family protein n=1 Tax=Chromobacterium subtsugae TaxID=251747 RepID=UPI0007F88F5A|nr:hypothetical protein [Chromobacterium subtsugae]OBU85210.1 hypothetical protein MY55_17890 [Chromobacterium subtsugae]
MLIRGACHCGNISFELDWLPEPAAIPARRCGCDFCRKHGGVWTACPGDSLKVRVSRPERVSKYRFGTATADFHVCAVCGAVPLVSSRIAGRVYAVVSVNALDDAPVPVLEPAPVSFDGESEAERLARRASSWIADVSFL